MHFEKKKKNSDPLIFAALCLNVFNYCFEGLNTF